MMVSVEGGMVDVLDPACADRECLHVGVDKGVFAVGHGYTRYRRVPRVVCLTRHTQGCPTNSVCPRCRMTTVEPPGTPHCGTLTEEVI